MAAGYIGSLVSSLNSECNLAGHNSHGVGRYLGVGRIVEAREGEDA